jgi:hypothetical protein
MRSLAATGATQRVVQQQLETQLLPFPDSLCRAKGLKTTHPEGCDYQFGSRTLQGAIQSLPFPDSLSAWGRDWDQAIAGLGRACQRENVGNSA